MSFKKKQPCQRIQKLLVFRLQLKTPTTLNLMQFSLASEKKCRYKRGRPLTLLYNVSNGKEKISMSKVSHRVPKAILSVLAKVQKFNNLKLERSKVIWSTKYLPTWMKFDRQKTFSSNCHFGVNKIKQKFPPLQTQTFALNKQTLSLISVAV